MSFELAHSTRRLLTSYCMQGAPTIAIEPLSSNLLRLRSSLCRNPSLGQRVTVIATAVGAETRKNCTLFSGITNQGDGILECSPNFTAPEGYQIRQHGVQVTRLDDLLEDVPDIAYIKMDIEGAEYLAAFGGNHTLFERGVPYIQVEYNAAALAHNTPDPPYSFLQLFVEAGYTLSLKEFNASQILSPEQIHHASGQDPVEVYLTYDQIAQTPSSDV